MKGGGWSAGLAMEFCVGAADVVGIEVKRIGEFAAAEALESEPAGARGEDGEDAFDGRASERRCSEGGFECGGSGGGKEDGAGSGGRIDGGEIFGGSENGVVEEAMQAAGSVLEKRGVELAAAGVEAGSNQGRRSAGARSDYFEAAQRDDGFAENFGPGFDGGEADAQAGEGTGAGNDGVEFNIFLRGGMLGEEEIEMAEEAGGVLIARCGRDGAEQIEIAEESNAAGRGGGVEREEKHGGIVAQSG